MPQLDANTFIFQYSTIIVVLALVYIALAYVVLPQILRALLMRLNIVRNSSTNVAAAPVVTLTLNRIVNNSSVLSLVGIRNNAISKVSGTAVSSVYATLNDNYTDYLTLMLIEEEYNNND